MKPKYTINLHTLLLEWKKKFKTQGELWKSKSHPPSSCSNPSFYPKSSPTSFLPIPIPCFQLSQLPPTNTLCTKFASSRPQCNVKTPTQIQVSPINNNQINSSRPKLKPNLISQITQVSSPNQLACKPNIFKAYKQNPKPNKQYVSLQTMHGEDVKEERREDISFFKLLK